MNKEKTRKEVTFWNRWIQPYHEKGYYTRIRVERKGKLIDPRNYKEGDLLYIFKYDKKRNYLQVRVYEIIQNDNNYDIKEMHEYQIMYINDIYIHNFSKSLQEEILNFFRYGRC